MSRDASITMPWADGDYTFRLDWAALEKLQEACDAGPYVILQRMSNGGWMMQDITNTIRLALIGGGLEPIAALKKVRAYVEDRPPGENLIYAQAILTAGCIGAPEEELGNGEAASPETE